MDNVVLYGLYPEETIHFSSISSDSEDTPRKEISRYPPRCAYPQPPLISLVDVDRGQDYLDMVKQFNTAPPPAKMSFRKRVKSVIGF